MLNWQELYTSIKTQAPTFLNVNPAEVFEKPVCFPLNDYRIITITGENAATFLQGQCTCNFVTLSEHESTYGSHCTPKGRMVASFVAKKVTHLNSSSPVIGLRVHKSCAQNLQESLSKYAVFSKVKVDISEELKAFAVIGVKKEQEPTAANSQTTVFAHGNGMIELWLTDTDNSSQEQSSQEQRPQNLCGLGNTQSWELLQIRQGIYDVRGETSGKLLPQEINHQLLKAIDFKKGCYTGQEIIARLHYKGQLKKHMRRVQITFDQVPPSLMSQNDDAMTREQLLEVLPASLIGLPLAAVKTEQTIEALTIVSDAIFQQKSEGSANDLNPKITWLPLPYAIP